MTTVYAIIATQKAVNGPSMKLWCKGHRLSRALSLHSLMLPRLWAKELHGKSWHGLPSAYSTCVHRGYDMLSGKSCQVQWHQEGEEAEGPLKDISFDFNSDAHFSSIDCSQWQLCRVSYYDNDYRYSNRVVDFMTCMSISSRSKKPQSTPSRKNTTEREPPICW